MDSKSTTLPTRAIIVGSNDRKQFNRRQLIDLAESIRQDGLISKPVLRPVGNKYEIVAGERRVRAMRDILGWTEIPCEIRQLSDEQASSIMLSENERRVDLNPIERAQAYQKRIDEFGWTIKQIAEAVNRDATDIRQHLALLNLADDIQHYIQINQFPFKYATRITHLDINRQRIAIKLFNKASNMPMYRWQDITRKLTEQMEAENQQPLFTLELQLMEQVEDNDDRPSKGKLARTGAEANRDLPPVNYDGKRRSMARVFDDYIVRLMEAGYESEAGAVANIYNTLVAHHGVFVPDGLLLPKISEAGNVSDELHENYQ